MQEYLGVLIAAVRSRIKQVVLVQVAGFGLGPQQFWMLVGIHEQPGVSQAALAERVRADAPTVSRTLATLLDRGLVRSDHDPGDRRRSRLYLTASGERLARELKAVAEEVRAAVVDGMSAAEEAALRKGLQRILVNLDACEARVRGRRP